MEREGGREGGSYKQNGLTAWAKLIRRIPAMVKSIAEVLLWDASRSVAAQELIHTSTLEGCRHTQKEDIHGFMNIVFIFI